MAGILDGLDSNIYGGAPAATAQPGAQQQPDIFKRLQQLFCGGGGYSVGGNPLGLGQNVFSVPQMHPARKHASMSFHPVESPNFAPRIQPHGLHFALLATLSKERGLAAMSQQP